MSVNPALLDGKPVPVNVDEVFTFSQDECEFFVESGSGYPGQGGQFYGSKGEVFVSNLRIVYIEHSARATFFAFSLPFYCIMKWKFNRPYFGPPSWSGKVNPVPLGGLNGVGSFQLTFTRKEGLNAFEQAVLALLEGSRAVASRVAEGRTPVVMMLAEEKKQEEKQESKMEKAFVDPDDPFQVHISMGSQSK